MRYINLHFTYLLYYAPTSTACTLFYFVDTDTSIMVVH